MPAAASGGAVLTSGGAVLTSGGVVLTSGGAAVTSGRAVLTSGRAVLTSGGAVLTSGRAVAASGRAVAASGRAVAASGCAVLTSGRAVAANGRGLRFPRLPTAAGGLCFRVFRGALRAAFPPRAVSAGNVVPNVGIAPAVNGDYSAKKAYLCRDYPDCDMKILHTADWHLGNTFHGHYRTDEQRHFLRWLLDALRERQPDALIVAGDVFDSPNPSAAAERLFYDFLEAATEAVDGLQVVVTVGNHDSAGRLEAPAALLERHRIYLRGVVPRTEKGEPDFARLLIPLGRRERDEACCVCFALPYLRSLDCPPRLSVEEGLRYYFDGLWRALKRSDYRGLPVVAAAHFYAAGAEVCEGEHSERLVVGGQEVVSADVAGRAAYVALGHIHKRQHVGTGEAWYAGSVLPMSFSEKHYRHGVQWVELDEESGRAEVSQLPYEPLRALVSLPASGALSVAELPSALAELPRREKEADESRWPYVELRVQEDRPEPSLMRDVATALADRAVRFCRMVRVSPAAAAPEEGPADVEALRTLSPLDMARRVFRSKYGSEMPEALETRFRQAEAAATATDD